MSKNITPVRHHPRPFDPAISIKKKYRVSTPYARLIAELLGLPRPDHHVDGPLKQGGAQ